MSGMTEEFGSMVFSDAVMQQRLPAEIYSALRSARQYGKRLTLAEADVVAEAMRDWAIERGATHYTHWFQPMTGITAEKHDSFLSPAKDVPIKTRQKHSKKLVWDKLEIISRTSSSFSASLFMISSIIFGLIVIHVRFESALCSVRKREAKS